MAPHFCCDCNISQFPCAFADLLKLRIPSSPNHLTDSEDTSVLMLCHALLLFFLLQSFLWDVMGTNQGLVFLTFTFLSVLEQE